MSDPIHELYARSRAVRRARNDSTYLSALLNGQPLPSPEAFGDALDMGHTGAEALEVARQLDKAGTQLPSPTPGQTSTSRSATPSDRVHELYADYQQHTGSQHALHRMLHDDQPPPAA